jgi:hypothetical protein
MLNLQPHGARVCVAATASKVSVEVTYVRTNCCEASFTRVRALVSHSPRANRIRTSDTRATYARYVQRSDISNAVQKNRFSDQLRMIAFHNTSQARTALVERITVRVFRDCSNRSVRQALHGAAKEFPFSDRQI